jgi:hypothetical protein
MFPQVRAAAARVMPLERCAGSHSRISRPTSAAR